MLSTLFSVSLVTAAITTNLATGFILVFAVVVMPGIRKMEDSDFIRAFQLMDGMIQSNQPVFVSIWMGSVLSLLAAATTAYWVHPGVISWALMVAAALNLLGVQLPTATVNIPLNNTLQTLDVKSMDAAESAAARHDFESTWNRWNVARCAVGTAVSATLVVCAWVV